MKDAAQARVRRIAQYVSRDSYDRGGDVGRIGRATVLVSNDTHFVPTFGQRQHRSYKVFAIGRIDPGGPKDNVLIVSCGDSLFAGQFRGAIGTCRPDYILFNVSALLRAIEYIVGGEVERWMTGTLSARAAAATAPAPVPLIEFEGEYEDE